jgi:hypothetical protein
MWIKDPDAVRIVHIEVSPSLPSSGTRSRDPGLWVGKEVADALRVRALY